jgi:DNA polymerase III alpha subunit (gram-positive type)
MKTITIFDVETNGFLNRGDHVVQFGYMIIRNREVLSEGSILFDRDIEWNLGAQKVHGITKEMAQQLGIRPHIFYKHDCHHILGSDILVGHNIERFDIPVILNDYKRLGLTPPDLGITFDTLVWSQDKWGIRGGNNKLGQVYEKMFDRQFANAHKALPDVRATANIFDKIIRSDPEVVDDLFGGNIGLYSEELQELYAKH